MKRKMKKKLIAFMLCMVLVICNSVSILADTPAAATTTAENQVSETKTAKNEKSSEETKSTDDNDTSKQSEETDETRDEAPEATTTEKKEETTEATTEEKEDATTATTEAEEATTEATTEDKATTEAADETSESDKKKEATTTENSSETSGTTEETTETADETTTTAEDDETTAATELKYEDEQVLITVTANEENAIPAGATLKVVPILKNDTATQAQYTEVEKQLKDKSEKEDYTTLGFLAYDITFVDEQGNEIEPDGQVVVNMSYKKAALPSEMDATKEEIADAQVSVFHLEENEAKQVQNIADLSENNQLQNIEVTDANEVTQAEFVAESFSVFTLTWGYGRIEAQIIDTKGNHFNTDNKEIRVSNWYEGTILFTNQNVENRNFYEIKANDGSNYCFVKAVVLNDNESYPENLGITIESLSRKQQNGYLYNYAYTYKELDEQGKEYVEKRGNFDPDSQTLYFVYAKDELTTIHTIDNEDAGITMRMIDYANPAQAYGETSLDNALGGQYTEKEQSGRVKQGLLKKVLQDDYPVTSGENTSNEANRSLKSLFSETTQESKTVNHLFSQDIYNATGYYEYSSFENYAYLSGNNFIVYEQIGTPREEEEYYFQRGNFMPFNPIVKGRFSSNTNLYDENGLKLDTSNPRYNEPLYSTFDEKTQTYEKVNNYYFGMYMEADFAQPKDGKVTHDGVTNDMVYEFNGDDDLWVYIDDVLVLDIGGIHDAHSGSINFATGEVVVNDSAKGSTNITQLKTTIKDCFNEARIFPDGKKWDDAKVSDYFTGNTLKNYSSHNIKMFYMERGGGASNLHVKFNIQPIPEGEIQISKELSNTDKDKYANVEFAFQVYVQEEEGTDDAGNPTFSDKFIPITQANKTKYPVVYNGTEQEVKWDENGNTFYLKPGETAAISGLQANQQYYVIETGVESDEYDDIKINDTSYEEFDENEDQIGKPVKDVKTTKAEVSDRKIVVYTNNCSGSNSRELWITKSMAEGQSAGTDEFTFKVELEGTDGQLQAYSGKYYINNDNNPQTTTNGIIKIQSGDTIKITGILAGTEFKVTEQDISDTYLDNPIIEEVEKDGNWGIKDFQGSKGFSSDEDTDTTSCTGEIILGKNAQVKFTNSKNVKSIYVEKKWEEGNDGNVEKDTVTFGVFKQKADDSLTLVQVADITTQNQWKHTFTDLPVKENNSDITYTIREVTETTQTGSGTYPLNGEQYRILNESDYINEYYHASDDPQGTGTSTSPFTIENGLKTFGINVVKKGSEGNWMKGVEFELCLDKAGTQKVYFVKTDTGYEYSSSNVEGASTTLITNDVEGTTTDEKDNPNLVITGLPADTYYLIETKTQSGFSLLANPVEIVLPCASSEKSDSQAPYYEYKETEGQTTYYYDSYTAVITNNKLFTMPEAGGRNIFMMTLAGTAMIALAAGSTIYYRRRRGAHNKTRR